MSELLPSRQNEGYGACDDEGGGLFPKTLFCRAVSDYELPNSRAVQSERLLLSINPSAALNGRHLPLHTGGFGACRAEVRTVFVTRSGAGRHRWSGGKRRKKAMKIIDHL